MTTPSTSTSTDDTTAKTDEATAVTAPEPSYDPGAGTFDPDDRDASYVHDYPSQVREAEAGHDPRTL